ncbi:MAG: amino acid adenylation domain-containing protein [Candidatus Zhuqueibacterota bacterium]
MTDPKKRISDLSPEKRALLMMRLKKKMSEVSNKHLIPRRENSNEFPMSYAQERMWFLHQWEPDSPLYNIPAAVRLTGNVDMFLLKRALHEVVRRHDVLRGVFTEKDNHPVQEIAPELELPFSYIDLRQSPPENREAEALQLISGDARKPFDLKRGPLFRVSLIQTCDTDYLFMLNMHHIVSDGWSIGVLIREVTLLYEAFRQNSPSPLPEIVIQYADFADWQKKYLRGDVLEKQLDYWKRQLGDNPPVLQLPTDRPRPLFPSFQGAYATFTLTPDLTDTLRKLSKANDSTLFMTLFAAFNILLHRYSGQDDISVGTPIANRNRSEIEGLIGFFVNTLVIRSNFSGNPTFKEFLGRVRDTATQAYSNQDVPFEMLVEAVQPNRDLSHTPLFQVMFALQENPVEAIRLPDFEMKGLEAESGTAKFDITLFMEERAGGLKGAFEYSTDLFDAATMENLIGHFVTMLHAIARHPEEKISALPLMAAPERRKVVDTWNATETEYPSEQSIQLLFEDQVEKTPDAIALNFNGTMLTYRELNERANRLAHYLKEMNVAPRVFVAMIMERSIDLIVATLGILKAGGVYVPLDTAYPKDRMAFMLEDIQAPVLLTQKDLLPIIPESTAKILCVDANWDDIRTYGSENIPCATDGSSLAYVIYTSGSTGKPKGVAVPHQAITRLVRNTNYVDITPEDKIAQAANASFDAATYEIWGALLNGATLVGMSKDLVLSSHQFVTYLREQGISIMFLTTALFNQIANEIPDAFATLKNLSFGGEAVDPNAVRQVVQAGPPKNLLHVYGPTENTTFTTWFRVEQVPANVKTIPIGRSIANTTNYVLDKMLNPVPVGVPGELFCGGDGLAEQYLNRPDLTAEKFIPNPFSRKGGQRLYRTGDLVRLLPDGAIEFIGRIDHQVKIRGFRIEIGEIESVLKNHPSLKDVIILAREDKPGERRLVAYVVPHEKQAPTTTELRSFLKEKLPDYMVPSFFMIMESFPINPNGKVDRKALPTPEMDRPDLDKEFVAPRDKLESALAAMWQDILGIEKVGIYDNFFELGGNSLQAAVFVNRIKKEFGEDAHVRSIFMAPTIAQFSMYIHEYYGHVIKEFFGEETVRTGDSLRLGDRTEQIEKIDAAKVQQIRRIITPLQPYQESAASQAKNPPAVFVLSPPRSGSTLFRVMLAGNPKLFAPPELDILSFNTLAERRQAFADDFSIWLEATWRAIMEIKNCDLETARSIMEESERQQLSSKEFYRQLQEWIGDRLLVDKTPSYPLDIEILKRAEASFDKPYYIHLTRHPYATIYSFLEAKLDKNFFRYEHPFSRQELSEIIWIICHQNILEFLKDIPEERQIRINFESLVTYPEPILQGVCEFLNIDFHPGMLKPYEGKKMTDGVTANSQMVGDFKFYLHKDIDNRAANRWKDVHTTNFLSDIAWEIAGKMNYKKTPDLDDSPAAAARKRSAVPAIQPIPRDGELPLSFQQQRLWFLDQMEPGSPAYNIPVTIRIDGVFDVAAAEKCIQEIVRRHEVLRTHFTNEQGKAALRIAPELRVPFVTLDISSLPEHLKEAEALNLALTEAKRPFLLDKDPLIRGLAIRLSEQSHVLVMTMHHIISDGWSTGVIIQEFAALYQSKTTGAGLVLPELKIQYADYANWQRQWLRGEVLEEQLDFWREQLHGAPPMLELPTDHPRPAEVTYSGASERFAFPAALTEAVKSFSKKENATEFMTLLAAFQVLLYRYSGEPDINVGTPIANRGQAELEGLIGFFVNTLVIRSRMFDNPSYRALLQQVREASLGAYSHQELPFEMLVDKLQPQRDMSHTPLFQAMFAFQNMPVQHLELPNCVISPFNIGSVTSKFELTMSIREYQGEFRGTLEYNTDIYEAATIKRMIQHFQVLLEHAVKFPDVTVADLPLLPVSEQRRILDEWNATVSDYPSETTIQQLFERQVEKNPDGIAVRYGEATLTYSDLNRRANQLGRYLRKQGVGPDVLVGVCMERSVELVVGLMGVLKAGGAYVALDPSYPKDRLAYILQDTRVPVQLTLARMNLEPLGVPVDELRLDADWAEIEKESGENPEHVAAPENLAYLIYTSGSTGRPKGVMMQHRSAINLWAGLNRSIYVNHPARSMRVSLNAPLLFDASVQQLVMLMSGHTLDILPQDARLDGFALLDYIRKSEIDVLDCVPSQLKMLIIAGLFEEKGWVPSILLPGGEAIDDITWKTLRDSEKTDAYNMYGPTECAVDSTICRVKESDGRPVIGRPINNARLYVLDKNLRPAPIGVPGELFIAGHGLARGYLNRADLTAEKFIPDPFGAAPGARMYRTGDLVRYVADGNVEFIRRIDHQVKVRGFRIELGEIEANLDQHPSLKEAVVIVREDEPGNKRLVAYLIPKNGEPPNISDLRSYLKTKLPEYMVPSAFVYLDKLPLTPNGKIDRKALPVPEVGRPELSGEFMEARNETEQKLAAVWQEVLGIDRIGVNDNFFELGGDSILTIQVIAKSKQRGLQLTPKQLFQFPTIAGLAEVAGAAAVIQAEQGIVTGEIALTPIQRNFFEQQFPEPHHWNQSILLEMRESLDVDRLKRAVKLLISHHDALRLRFQSTEQGWKQVNDEDDQDLPFLQIDLSKLPQEEYGKTIESFSSKLQGSLNFTDGPVAKFALFNLGDETPARLLIAIHHLAIDGISWRILLEDLYNAYVQLSEHKAVRLPAKTTSFRQWSMRLSGYANSEKLKNEWEYWRTVVDQQTTQLPLDFEHGSNVEGDTATEKVTLSEEETRALLQDVPAVYGTEINDALLAAVSMAFRRWAGVSRLRIDLEGHGREDLFDDVDISRTVGWFTSLFPVVLNIENEHDVAQVLKSTKEQVHGIPNKGIGFGLLRFLSDDESVRNSLRASQTADVSFNYLGQFDHIVNDAMPFAPAKESSGVERSLVNPRSHSISINGSIIGGALQISWMFSKAMYRSETMQQLARGFIESLREIIAHCQSPEAGGYTPSDFADVALQQDELDELMTELNQ